MGKGIFGRPLSAEVDALVAAIGETPDGETVTHARIEAILGYGRGDRTTERRYREVLRAFQRWMLLDGRPVTGIDAAGHGLRFLAPGERVRAVDRRLHSAKRQLHTGVRVVITVDKTLLTPDQLRLCGKQEVLLARATGALKRCGLKLLQENSARLTTGS